MTGTGASLSLHALDTVTGRPCAGLGFALFRLEGKTAHPLAHGETDADGRWSHPRTLAPGGYELRFAAGAWQTARGRDSFYDLIPIRFHLARDAARTHVPLLLSPFGYTTYRGS